MAAKFSHVTSIHRFLHWLKINERTYKVLATSQPA